jgi:hypothetical protein
MLPLLLHLTWQGLAALPQVLAGMCRMIHLTYQTLSMYPVAAVGSLQGDSAGAMSTRQGVCMCVEFRGNVICQSAVQSLRAVHQKLVLLQSTHV